MKRITRHLQTTAAFLLLSASYLPAARGVEPKPLIAPEVRLDVQVVQVNKDDLKLMATRGILSAESTHKELAELEARGILKLVNHTASTSREGVPSTWSEGTWSGSKELSGIAVDSVCFVQKDRVDMNLVVKIRSANGEDKTTEAALVRPGKTFCFPVLGGEGAERLFFFVTPTIIARE